MDDGRQQEYERAFRQLKQAYIRRLYNTIRVIDNILELEGVIPINRNDLMRAQALVHGLAGSGATFGYPQITEIGREADHFLEELLKHQEDNQITDEDHNELVRLLKKNQQVCRTIYNESRVEYPELANTNIYMKPGTQEHAHILIVDDDQEVASAISQSLQSQGMSIQISSSGEDALHYLGRVRPDLVILDLSLRGMNGMEVLQQIKQNSEFIDIPVMILATRYNEGDELFALKAGALAYVRKPVNTQALSEQVKQIANRAASNTQSI